MIIVGFRKDFSIDFQFPILNAAGIKFEVRPTDADENVPDDIPVCEAVEMIAKRKCSAAAEAAEMPQDGDDVFILAADTAAAPRRQQVLIIN